MSPGAVSSAMNDHTTRRMYTKRAPGDINIYAMNEDLTTKELSKIEKQRLANRQSYQRYKEERKAYNSEYYQANRERCIELNILNYNPERRKELYRKIE